MNENQDLLDLCQLNQIEEKLKKDGIFKGDSKKAIDWKKRNLIKSLKFSGPSFTDEQMKKYKENLKRQSEDIEEITEEEFLHLLAKEYDIDIVKIKSIHEKYYDDIPGLLKVLKNYENK